MTKKLCHRCCGGRVAASSGAITLRFDSGFLYARTVGRNLQSPLAKLERGLVAVVGTATAQTLFESLAPALIPIETLSRYAFLVRMPVARQLKWLPSLALFNQAELRPARQRYRRLGD